MPIVHDPATGRFVRSGASRGKAGGGAKALATKGKLSYRGVTIKQSEYGNLTARIPPKKLANGVRTREQVFVQSGGAEGLAAIRKQINRTFKAHTELAAQK